MTVWVASWLVALMFSSGGPSVLVISLVGCVLCNSWCSCEFAELFQLLVRVSLYNPGGSSWLAVATCACLCLVKIA